PGVGGAPPAPEATGRPARALSRSNRNETAVTCAAGRASPRPGGVNQGERKGRGGPDEGRRVTGWGGVSPRVAAAEADEGVPMTNGNEVQQIADIAEQLRTFLSASVGGDGLVGCLINGGCEYRTKDDCTGNGGTLLPHGQSCLVRQERSDEENIQSVLG